MFIMQAQGKCFSHYENTGGAEADTDSLTFKHTHMLYVRFSFMILFVRIFHRFQFYSW